MVIIHFPNRSSSPVPGGGSVRRGSRVNLTETLPDENNDLLDPNHLELVDEYFYGVRIFPGQDPSLVYCGWVDAHFKHYDRDFGDQHVRQVIVHAWPDENAGSLQTLRQSCYMMNAAQLQADVSEPDASSTGRSNQGMFVGCHVDVATGRLSFTANGKRTRFEFACPAGQRLYPAVFFEASTKDVCQFELGRTAETLPLSAALLKSTGKHLTPQYTARLRVQVLRGQRWARCENRSLAAHALKLSDLRGWSVLADEPVAMLALHVPEDDRCVDILELIENERLLQFHAKTLALYCALCYQGNTRAAHMICGHVDEKQLMYAIQSEYMSGPLRSAFADLLIALHLEQFAYARSLTQNEYIVALDDQLSNLYGPDERAGGIANSISSLGCASIRPEMKASERVERVETVKGLSSPVFPVQRLKQFLMEALDDAVRKSNRPMRDAIGGSNEQLFVPLIKLIDKLLLIGCIDDNDLEWLLRLIDPSTFGELKSTDGETAATCSLLSGPGVILAISPLKGLMQMHLDEGVKLQMTHLFHHLFDLQLRHRVESIVAFCDGYVGELQQEQLRRYSSVKQEDLPAAVAAKRTKEFRCSPREQMRMILGFKQGDDDNAEYCPSTDETRQKMFEFHDQLMNKVVIDKQEEALAAASAAEAAAAEALASRSRLLMLGSAGFKRLLGILSGKPIGGSGKDGGDFLGDLGLQPEDAFCGKVVATIIQWARDTEIEDRELIRQMFYLLLRSYDGVGELMGSLEKTYIISSTSKEDVQLLLRHLDVLRSLLPVQMSPEEEEIMRDTLWALVMNRVFFQHPDLIKILRMHENVMHIMTNTLSKRAQGESGASAPAASSGNADAAPNAGTLERQEQGNAIGDTSAMVVACCRFLCYFCRSSRQNQKAMFQHLNFLLENSNILLSRPSLRGSTPLDVASSSVMENPELALALRETYLEKIAIYLSKCGFQSNQELLDKGYPDIGWDPVEGERYLDFFRTCVWVNGESVEENANLVIRLLIRRPECLGPALRGEGEGLLQAMKDAIAMSQWIQERAANETTSTPPTTPQSPLPSDRASTLGALLVTLTSYPDEQDEDYIDLGAAVLNFYSALVDLLGRCAPEASAIAEAKNECIRARAILRSLVPMDDLEGVLALRFSFQPPGSTPAEPNSSDLLPGIQPVHKQSMVLFLERVYGIETQEVFFRLLEDAFLPDLRAATILERADGSESQMALALNRYLGNAVLPLLIKNSHFFSNAEQWSSVMDATLHTVYRLCKVKILTKGQRECVSDFLVALTHEMQPAMLLGLLRKLTVDVSVLNEYSTVALRLLTLHYERCGRYYAQGGATNFGSASAEERRLTMLLFSNIFDSLAKMEYDPDLFMKALPCLTAIACALPPDYSLPHDPSSSSALGGLSLHGAGSKSLQTANAAKSQSANNIGTVYTPNPVKITTQQLRPELQRLVDKFAEYYHDAWAARRFELGWNYGERLDETRKRHPKLKPFKLLTSQQQTEYRQPVDEAVRTLLALGWKLQPVSEGASSLAATGRGARPEDKTGSVADYNPNPLDMSSLTLSRELLALAEQVSENSHERWAARQFAGAGRVLHPKLVPYELLTDKEKRDTLELSQELLKFVQYEGFEPQRPQLELDKQSTTGTGLAAQSGLNANAIQTRFATSLLEKLLAYLDTAAISLKLLKPSENFSRRMSFKQQSRDIKFFSKVVLPLVERLFNAHRAFFLASPQVNNAASAIQVPEAESAISVEANPTTPADPTKSTTGAAAPAAATSAGSATAASGSMATSKEKEMVASLFCKLAELLRTRLPVMHSDAKISVRCLQVLVNATDLRTIVRHSPDFVKTSLLTFFNHAADDLANCVTNLQQARHTAIRGTAIKCSSSLNYVQLVLLPVLTSLFDHTASNEFGADLLLNDIQVACYKLLNSLYTLGTNSQLHCARAFIKRELDFHRSAVGNCLGAFAATFPVAFLEPNLNRHNRLCIHSRTGEYSLEAQAVMQELQASMPTLEDLMSQFDKYIESSTSYLKEPATIDVILPMLCAYLSFWYHQGPDCVAPTNAGTYVTMVSSQHLNRMLRSVLNLLRANVALAAQPWMVCLAAHAGMVIVSSVDEQLLIDSLLPLAQRIHTNAERAFHREEVLKNHMKSAPEAFTELETQLQDEYAVLVRDLYAFLPLLIKYVDLQRSHWLKANTAEAEQIYHCIAGVFSVWSKSQYMRKEEANFISANEIDNMALIMPSLGRPGRLVITKSDRIGHFGAGGTDGGVGGSGQKKKKKRDGKRDKDKELAASLMVSGLKKLLPVGLNLFAGREQELVQYAKEKLLKREGETDIFDYIKLQLNLPEQIDPSDAMSWQHYLYSKLGGGGAASNDGKSSQAVAVVSGRKPVKAEDKEKMQERLVARIIDMSKVLFGLHMVS